MTEHTRNDKKAGASERQVRLPLSKAFEISWRNMRARFGRTLITAGGIVLGIAFLMYIWTSQAQLNAIIEKAPEEVTATMNLPGEEARVQNIWLVTLSLLVSAVAISNAMLMSVTERYREIGTMKCLGALNSFIARLFVLEALFLGLAGALQRGGALRADRHLELLRARRRRGHQRLRPRLGCRARHRRRRPHRSAPDVDARAHLPADERLVPTLHVSQQRLS